MAHAPFPVGKHIKKANNKLYNTSNSENYLLPCRTNYNKCNFYVAKVDIICNI